MRTPGHVNERVRRTVETYERVAETYADSHGDRSVVADIVERFVTAVVDVDRGDRGSGRVRPRVLDVGCGPGWESATFADAGLDPVSFDLTRSFLDQTRERVPQATPVRGDMRALLFADDNFDGLWACASLLHVPESDVPATLAEFERVLGDGGVVVCSLKAAEAGDGRTRRTEMRAAGVSTGAPTTTTGDTSSATTPKGCGSCSRRRACRSRMRPSAATIPTPETTGSP